ncbi:MAG TPA: hypothetical protein VFX59_21095, partial [Polyangiales bacterium]|nr:hypothetical protein [Polyangiales bacterium]
MQLVASALLACSPLAGSEDRRDVVGADGGSGVIRDDAGNISYTQATVHTAGLRGKGLALTINGAQAVPVPSDGIWKVPLPAPMSTIDILVATQPIEPHQRCDVTKIDENVFTVVCDDQLWNVSGTIVGYEGKGLKLGLFDDKDDAIDGTAHSLFNAAIAGEFMFPRALPDDSNYQVRILEQPTEPRQDCVLENEEGFADGFDITNVKVTCTTKSYVFSTVITGLRGTGLSVRATDGDYKIDNPGLTTYADAPRPDGFRYDIKILTQPK